MGEKAKKALPVGKPAAGSAKRDEETILDTDQLVLKIPSGATDEETEVTVNQSTDEVQQQITDVFDTDEVLTPPYNMQPKGKEWMKPVELTAQVPSDGRLAQPTFWNVEEGSVALTRVPSKVTKNEKGYSVTSRVNKFGDAFVAEDIGPLQDEPSSQEVPDAIAPGLNLRGRCQNSSCDWKGRYVTSHGGYVPNWNVAEKTFQCPRCQNSFTPSQMVVSAARYTLSLEGGETPEKEVCGVLVDVIPSRYTITIRQPRFNSGMQNNFSNVDVAQDGAFEGVNVLFGCFCQEDTYSHPFCALTKKGFACQKTTSPSSFCSMLPNFEVCVVISD